MHRGQTISQCCCYRTWPNTHPLEFLYLSGPTSLLSQHERAPPFFYFSTLWELLNLEIKIHEVLKREEHSDVCEGHTLAAFLFLPLTSFHIAHQPIKEFFFTIQQPAFRDISCLRIVMPDLGGFSRHTRRGSAPVTASSLQCSA